MSTSSDVLCPVLPRPDQTHSTPPHLPPSPPPHRLGPTKQNTDNPGNSSPARTPPSRRPTPTSRSSSARPRVFRPARLFVLVSLVWIWRCGSGRGRRGKPRWKCIGQDSAGVEDDELYSALESGALWWTKTWEGVQISFPQLSARAQRLLYDLARSGRCQSISNGGT
jgi:hypothetical protein